MAGNKLYARIDVYGVGSLLTEETSVSVSRETGNAPMITVARGFAGVTPGAPMLKVHVENAVPQAGIEFDPGAYMIPPTPVEMTFYMGNKALTAKGYIMNDEVQHKANGESSLTFDFLAPYKTWE